MATRFELVLEQDKYTFQLRTTDGRVLLKGLGSPSKIMTQNEILHVRSALRDPQQLVAHHDGDRHFLIVKDKDGSVLAKSPHLGSEAELTELMPQILAVTGAAPIVDLSKKRAAHVN